eukprot:m.365981 g.365981  ORF g.365981 m.365981 type:complete len:716 (-) comp16658_c1_seq1:352-2499(-)
MATDFPIGLNVWAKIVESRPWPAYVINKRRPTAKHKDLCPVHFYGPEEEFSWVEPDCVIPLTADNIVEFSRDGCDDPAFFAAVYQAYKGQAWSTPEADAIFRTVDNLFEYSASKQEGSAIPEAFEETKDMIAQACLQYIHAATPTRTKTSSLLTAEDASLLAGIFDDSIPPPSCLLESRSTDSGSEGDDDVFEEEDAAVQDTARDTQPTNSATTTTSSSSNPNLPTTPQAPGKRPMCPLPGCGKTFANEPALYGHMRVHGGSYSKRSRSSSSGSTSAEGKRRVHTPDAARRVFPSASPARSEVPASSMETEETASIPSTTRRNRVPFEGSSVRDSTTQENHESAKYAMEEEGVEPSLDRLGPLSAECGMSAPRTQRVGGKKDDPIRVRPSSAPAGLGSSSGAFGDLRSGKDTLIEHYESRVGPEYQATVPGRPDGGTSSSGPGGELVWKPTDEPSGVDLTDYLKFACTKGMLGPGMERWTSRGCEHAMHVMHKASSGAKNSQAKPLIIRALLTLTERKRCTGGAPITDYHYEGDTVWTTSEIEKFKKGLKTHGKNFPYIQSSSLKTKSLADLIEFYYYFKSTDAYKPIRAALKLKEQQEFKRALEEGLLTCDNCGKTSTVEWHVGSDGQDWCDSCHAFFTKRTVGTVRSTLAKPKTDIRRQPGAYKCQYCEKVFQWPNSLYGHMRVHAESKGTKQRSLSTSSDKKGKAKKSTKPS